MMALADVLHQRLSARSELVDPSASVRSRRAVDDASFDYVLYEVIRLERRGIERHGAERTGGAALRGQAGHAAEVTWRRSPQTQNELRSCTKQHSREHSLSTLFVLTAEQIRRLHRGHLAVLALVLLRRHHEIDVHVARHLLRASLRRRLDARG